MSETEKIIPIWDAHKLEEPSEMILLHGEGRWYLWMQHQGRQRLAELRRQILLLHQDKDLSKFKKKKKVKNGVYACAFHENKMIRCRVLEVSHGSSESASSKDEVTVVDVDDGKIIKLPLEDLRVLPECAMSLPVQAIRCDLGLECVEQFAWPPQINTMLSEMLANARFYVKFVCVRPGTIPTILAEIQINSNTGTPICLTDWLKSTFSNALDACGLSRFKPQPVGQTYQPTLPTLSPSPLPCPGPSLPSPPVQPPLLSPAPPFPPGLTLPPGPLFPPHCQIMMSQPPPHFAIQNNVVPMYPFQTVTHIAQQRPVYSLNPAAPVWNGNRLRAQIAEIPDNFTFKRDESMRVEERPKVSVDKEVKTEKTADKEEVKSEKTADKKKDTHSKKSKVESRDKDLDKNEKQAEEVGDSFFDPLGPRNYCPPYEEIKSKQTLNAPEPLPRKSLEKTSERMKPTIRNDANNSAKKNDQVVLEEIPRDWKIGEVVAGIVAHVWDPGFFEVNVFDEYAPVLIRLEEEMNSEYGKKQWKKPFTSKSMAEEIGSFCACYDETDSVWYRGRICDWNSHNDTLPIIVASVDHGGIHKLDLKFIRPLVGKIATKLPFLATVFTMKNIRPKNPELDQVQWTTKQRDKFKELLKVEGRYFFKIEGKKGKSCWPVSVFSEKDCSGDSVNDLMVKEDCAFYSHSIPEVGNLIDFDEDKADSTDWNPMAEDYEEGLDYSRDKEDAIQAVTGRKYQDEVRLCSFFSEHGYCYKKVCGLKHVVLNSDGWTTDREEVHLDCFMNEPLPEPGDIIHLTATRVLNVNNFIGIMHLPKERKMVTEESLSSMLQDLNLKAFKNQLKYLTSTPAFGQIVVGRLPDNRHIRGRVVSQNLTDDDKFTVVDVDKGYVYNLSIRDLREIDVGSLNLPFQATNFYLSDVMPSYENKDEQMRERGMKVLGSIIQGHKLKAKVMHRDFVDVLLWDTQNKDVASILVEGKFLRRRIVNLPCATAKMIPG